MNATDAARRLHESNPVTEDAFAGAAGDGIGRATFERIMASPPRPEPGPGRGWSRRRLLAIGAGAAVAAGLLAILLPGTPRLTHAVRSAWQPAHALPRGGATAGPGGPTGMWRLASYLVNEGWQENTTGPEAGYLTCPTTTTCYVQGNNASSASGPADMNSFYVSTDGAASWSVLPVPSGLTFSSALSCGSAASCAAGGLFHGQPVFVTTASGGHSWTIDPLPARDGQIFQLSCPTATACGALATPSATLPLGQQYYGRVRFLAITDNGRHFAASAVVRGDSMQDVSCPTASHCVAIGVHNRDAGVNQPLGSGVVATSTDGGTTWSSGVLPRGLGVGPFPQVTCVNAGHCFMLGYTHSQQNAYSDIAVSADGGGPGRSDPCHPARRTRSSPRSPAPPTRPATPGAKTPSRSISRTDHPTEAPRWSSSPTTPAGELEPGHLRPARPRAARPPDRRLHDPRQHPVPAAERVRRARCDRPRVEDHPGVHEPARALAGGGIHGRRSG